MAQGIGYPANALNYAQQNAANCIVEPTAPALDMLQNALAEICQNLEVIRSRTQSIADRMFGPTPQAVPDQKPTVGAQGMPVLRCLESIAESLNIQARRLSDELQRLERL